MKGVNEIKNNLIGAYTDANIFIDSLLNDIYEKEERIEQLHTRKDEVEEMVSSLTEKTKVLLAKNEALERELKKRQGMYSAADVEHKLMRTNQYWGKVADELVTERNELQAKIKEMESKYHCSNEQSEWDYTKIAVSQIMDRVIIETSCMDEFEHYVDNLRHMLKDDFKMLLDKKPGQNIKVRLEISAVKK